MMAMLIGGGTGVPVLVDSCQYKSVIVTYDVEYEEDTIEDSHSWWH